MKKELTISELRDKLEDIAGSPSELVDFAKSIIDKSPEAVALDVWDIGLKKTIMRCAEKKIDKRHFKKKTRVTI